MKRERLYGITTVSYTHLNHAGENIGDVFPWIITTTVPLKDDEEIYNKYIITDVIDSRLDFVNEEKISIEMRDSYGKMCIRDSNYTRYVYSFYPSCCNILCSN